MRHVQCRQVHQLEGPELETHLVAQDAVNGGEVGHALADDAQCLGAKTTPGVVDDEARCVLRLHRGVPHFAGVGCEGFAQGWFGLEACYHLHHFHQRHGVEEMETGQSFGLLQRGCNGRHRQGRSVGCPHHVGWQGALQLCEECLLDLKTLHHRLNHQLARPEISQSVGNLQLVTPGLDLLFCHAAFGGEFGPLLLDGLPGFVCCAGLGIKQPDVTARLCRNLRYALAHGPRAHHGDAGKMNFHSAIMAAALRCHLCARFQRAKNKINCETP